MKATKKVLAVLVVLLLAATVVLVGCKKKEEVQEAKTIKAGFVYVGPVGDYGWSHAHDQGRLYVDSKFPWLETAYSEAVPEGDALRYIDRYVDEGYDIVFTTSFGFMDDTVTAAEKHSENIFWHCSGYRDGS